MTSAQQTAEKATSRIGGAFSNLGGIVGGEFGSVLGEAGEGIAGVGEHLNKATAIAGATGAGLAGAGIAFSEMAKGDQEASAQLKAAIEASGGSFSDYQEEIEKTIKSNENYNFSASDTQQALAKLTEATGDPQKALEQMNVVTNLAAAKHESLADASSQVAKILGGSGAKTLAEYGIHLDSTKDKTEAGQEALEQLSGKLSGQASASVDSFGGQIDVAKTKLTDWAAEMGGKVGPALTGIGTVLTGASAGLQLFKTITAGTKVTQEAATVATDAATTSQWAFNVALDANPIGIIILAVAALVAGLVWFFTQTQLGQELWGDFMTGLGDAWNWLWGSVLQPGITALGDAWNWLWSVLQPVFAVIGATFGWLWNNILQPIFGFIEIYIGLLGYAFQAFWVLLVQPALAGMGAAFAWLWGTVLQPALAGMGAGFTWLWTTIIQPVFSAIGAVAAWLWNSAISPAFSAIGNGVNWVGSTFRSIFGGVYDWLTGLWNGLGSVLKAPINAVIDLMNGAIQAIDNIHFTMPSWLGGQTIGFNIGKIPKLASGAIITKPTIAEVGESGAEAIVPLNAGRLDTGGQNITLEVNVQAGVIADEASLARTILTLLGDAVKKGWISASEIAQLLKLQPKTT